MQQLVEIRNGVAMTSSLEVAARFDKRHADVLRAVQSLECSKDFTERNFAFSDYVDSTGRKLPMCWMSRDGWSMLVMGFQGKKAAEWKEKFLSVFATMEKTLVSDARVPAVPADYKGLMRLIGEFAAQQEKQLDSERQQNKTMMDERTSLINRMRAAERHRDEAKDKLEAVARHSYKALKEVVALIDAEQDDLMSKSDAAPKLTLISKPKGE